MRNSMGELPLAPDEIDKLRKLLDDAMASVSRSERRVEQLNAKNDELEKELACLKITNKRLESEHARFCTC